MCAAAVTSDLIPDMLREYGSITRATLREYLPSRSPRRHLYDLKAQAVTEKLEDPTQLGLTRRDIARLLTEQSSRANRTAAEATS